VTGKISWLYLPCGSAEWMTMRSCAREMRHIEPLSGTRAARESRQAASEGRDGSRVNADEVRNVKFGGGMYYASQVDDLLERIAAELDAGRPAGPLITNAMFRTRLFTRGYDIGAVDWFLEQLRRPQDHSEVDQMNADPWRHLAAEPYYIRREPGDLAGRVATPSEQEYADAWGDFGQQPGTRLSWVRTGATRRELRTADLQTVASARSSLGETFSAGGRTFTQRGVTESTWPRIAETISRDRLGHRAHELKRQADGRCRRKLNTDPRSGNCATARRRTRRCA
jgi:DivIVA domain-containing protein